jgi:adenylosuccinate lyase
MLVKAAEMIKSLLVYPERMKKNIMSSYGLVFSQRVLLALIERGLSREEAYALVQRNAMRAWSENMDFLAILKEDSGVIRYLPAAEIEKIFDYGYYLKHIDDIFARFGL